MAVPPALFYRARFALGVTQVQLSRMLGASRRTGQRWDAGQAFPSAFQLAQLAKAVHARDPVLAEEAARAAQTTVEALGLVSASPPPAVPAAAPPPVESVVDSVVCAAAEAIDVTPRAVRPALIAAFARARELQVTIEAVERGLAVKPPPKAKKTAASPAT